jgi:glutathione synthase/RimK-type ligase-like ATP-grasp enzyme
VIVPGSTKVMRVTADAFSGPDVIDRIDALIAVDPTSVRLHFARACALQDLCRNAEAERAFLDVLAREPAHFGALTNLGALLHVAGKREVARALYTKAAIAHPGEPIAYVNLGNALAEDGEIDAAIATYEQAFAVAPGFPNAHYALSLLYRELDRKDDALRHHQLAFANANVIVSPALATDLPIDLLLLVAANGGNVVTAPLIDRRVVRIYRLVVEGFRPDMLIPEHHVVFNAVGDADRASAALACAAQIVATTGAPVINPPARVMETGRAAVTDRLGALPGVVAPRTRLLARDAVTPAGLAASGFTFPLLLRSPGYHTGQHFVDVATADDLAAALAPLPGTELLVIAFVDGRRADGNFRKYRVLFIGGRLYPLHLAISRHWKVHYFSADMTQSEDHRAEEAAFLADMDGVLGARTIAALERICTELGLDYGGIDFGLDAAGNVLVYEANATMAVFPAPPDPRFDYRRPAVARVLDAVHALVRERARAGGYAEA